MNRIFTYENKMVAICMLCFGFAMFDRFAVTNLSPYIMEELQMNNTQLGRVMAAFSLAWAFSGFFASILSDITANKKRMLGFFVLLFTACSLITGLAQSFAMLLLIRMIMGFFEGPLFPILQAFSLAQSSVKRRGLNMGLISTTSMGVIANLIGPILLVALCEAYGWRPTFFFTLIPGLIVTLLIFTVLREPDMTRVEGAGSMGGPEGASQAQASAQTSQAQAQASRAQASAQTSQAQASTKASRAQAQARAGRPTVRESLIALKNRNVRTSMIFGCFIVAWNVGTLAFAPTYLVSVKGFAPTQMSFIMAVFGVGAVVWGMLVPSLSDRYGRRPMAILFTMLSLISPLGLLLSSSPIIIGICVFAGWGGSGVFALHQAAIIGESVDTKYASTAMASVQMIGEIGGSVVGVAVAGVLADAYGLEAAFIFTGCCAVIASLVAFSYYETAPLVLARRRGQV